MKKPKAYNIQQDLEQAIQFITRPQVRDYKEIALHPENTEKWPKVYTKGPLMDSYIFMGSPVTYMAKLSSYEQIDHGWHYSEMYIFLTASSHKIQSFPSGVLPVEIQAPSFDAIFPFFKTYGYRKSHAYALSDGTLYRFSVNKLAIAVEKVGQLPAKIKQSFVMSAYAYFLLETGEFWYLDACMKLLRPYHACVKKTYLKASVIFSNEYMRSIFVDTEHQLVYMPFGQDAKENTRVLSDQDYAEDTIAIPLIDSNRGIDGIEGDLVYSRSSKMLLYLSNIPPEKAPVKLILEGHVLSVDDIEVYETTYESIILFFHKGQPHRPLTIQSLKLGDDECTLVLSEDKEILDEMKKRYATLYESSIHLKEELKKRLPTLAI